MSERVRLHQEARSSRVRLGGERVGEGGAVVRGKFAELGETDKALGTRRDAKTGRFASGNLVRGRRKGVPNLSTLYLKNCISGAMENLGDLDDDGKHGALGYLMWLGRRHPGPFASIAKKLLPSVIVDETPVRPAEMDLQVLERVVGALSERELILFERVIGMLQLPAPANRAASEGAVVTLDKDEYNPDA
jgi:hypothetical protein